MSSALVSAAAFVAAVVLVPAAASAAFAASAAAIRGAIASGGDPSLFGDAIARSGRDVIVITAPVLVAAAAAAIVTAGIQAGGNVALGKLAPDLARVLPQKGLASLVSTQRLVAIARAVATSLAVALVVRSELRDHAKDLAATLLSPAKAGVVASSLVSTLLRDVALVLLAAALVDVLVTRRAWLARHRMTRDEIKREHRESEGDPQLKAARERAHHELLAQASIHAVKDATVVVVNPTHLATALRYQEGEDDAPVVVSKGEGALAARIIEAAEQWNVPVVRDVPLARALHELEVGDEIPEALYEAVAEVLRTLWEAETAKSEKAP